MAPVLPELHKALHESWEGAELDRPLSPIERALFRQAKKRAADSRGRISFDLTEDEFKSVVASADGRCRATKIKFSEERWPSLKMRPFRPSLDRIESSKGYTKSNVHLVLASFNIAKNAYSPQLIHTIMMEYARANGAEIPLDSVLFQDENYWKY